MIPLRQGFGRHAPLRQGFGRHAPLRQGFGRHARVGAFALLGFGAAAAYWPDFIAAGTTSKWIFLSLAVPAAWAASPPDRPGLSRPALALGGAWLAWAALSLCWSAAPLDGALALYRYAVLAMVFALGASAGMAGLRAALGGFATAGAINGALALFQAGAGTTATGLTGNPNLLAETGLLALFACAALPRTAALGLAPLCLAAALGAAFPPASKMVFAAVAAAGFVFAARRSATAAAACVIAGAGAVAGATFIDGSTGSFAIRLAIWSDSAALLTAAGVGVGNFAAAFPAVADQTAMLNSASAAQAPHVAYNDFLQLAVETGWAALLPAALAVRALWKGRNDGAPFYIFVAFVALGAGDYPLHTPALAFAGCLCAGYLCRRRDDAGAGAGDSRIANFGVAAKPGAVGQGVAGAAGRGDVPVLANDPRSECAPGVDRAGHAAADRAAGPAPGAGRGAGPSRPVAETGRRAARLWRRGGRAGDRAALYPTLPPSAGGPALA